MATEKQKIQIPVFNTENQNSVIFLDVFQKLGEDAIWKAAPAIIEQSINAKMSQHLQKSINQAHLENCK